MRGKWGIVGVALVLALLALGTSLTQARGPDFAGVTVPYPGSLTDEAGRPVPDGVYAFAFALYEAEAGGEPFWTEVQEGVAVQGGSFTALLGGIDVIPKETLDGSAGRTASGGARWLEVGVRGPGEAEFTRLSPRQALSAVAPAAASVAPSAPATPSALSCAHTHLWEIWSGDTVASGLQVENTYTALKGVSSGALGSGVVGQNTGSGDGVHGSSLSGYGVYGTSSNSDGVRGEVYGPNGSGVVGVSSGRVGVYGLSSDSWLDAPNSSYGLYGLGGDAGVWGQSETSGGIGVVGQGGSGAGVKGVSTAGAGVYGQSTNGTAVFGHSDNGSGVRGEASTAGQSGVYGWNGAGGPGVTGFSSSGAAVSAVGTGKIYSSADSVIYLSPHDMVIREGDQSVVSLTFLDNGGVRVRNLTGAPPSVTRYLAIPVSTFGTLFGSPLYIKSLKVCYKAPATATFIGATGVYKNPGGDGGWVGYIENTTDWSSTTYDCYTVTAATPRQAIDNSTWVQFNVRFAGSGSGWDVYVYTVELTLTERQN